MAREKFYVNMDGDRYRVVGPTQHSFGVFGSQLAAISAAKFLAEQHPPSEVLVEGPPEHWRVEFEIDHAAPRRP